MYRFARTPRLLAAVSIISLAGCFSLGRATPPLEQYVLGASGATTAAPAAPDSGTLTIGLRRLDLAAYLSTRLIVVRRGAHQIVTSDFRRWGEDPGEGINRVVGAHLSTAQPVRTVDVAPWPTRSQHDFLVAVHVSRFEGVADSAVAEGSVHVLAAWEIIRPQDNAVVARGRTDHREGQWTVGDYAGLVILLDTALGRVARDIRTCLGRLAVAAGRPADQWPAGPSC